MRTNDEPQPEPTAHEQRTRQQAGMMMFSLSPTPSPTVQGPRVDERPKDSNSDSTVARREPCGLLGYSIFCPTTFQGVIGRFLARYLD
jgi:hypothetical protein